MHENTQNTFASVTLDTEILSGQKGKAHTGFRSILQREAVMVAVITSHRCWRTHTCTVECALFHNCVDVEDSFQTCHAFIKIYSTKFIALWCVLDVRSSTAMSTLTAFLFQIKSHKKQQQKERDFLKLN